VLLSVENAATEGTASNQQPEHNDESDSGSQDRTPCMHCGIEYCVSKVKWYLCKNCEKWACGTCARMGWKTVFVCDSCRPVGL